MNAGIPGPELRQHRQQEDPQGDLGGRDTQNPSVQPAASAQGLLPGLKLLKGSGHMAVQRLSLGGKLHMAVVPKEQNAAQLPLQILDDPANIGLAVSQRVCRLGKTPGFCRVVKNTISFIADIHGIHHINLILHYKKDIFYI